MNDLNTAINPCKQWEPSVINNALIEECINEQIPNTIVGDYIREDGISVEELEQVVFGYKNILRIDHLWVFKNLKKLHLNNNFIEKIENLEMLENLTDLDLSFNKITKIENLDTLVNITNLSLYENFISQIENLDCLTKLQIFSIGKNLIDDIDNIFYFRRFEHLNSLNMTKNPCAEIPNFRCMIGAFLPKLVYYEYKIIEPKERSLGEELFAEDLKRLTDTEKKDLELIEKNRKEKADFDLHSLWYVENLNSDYLFKQMFDGDYDGEKLLDMGELPREFFYEYEEDFKNTCFKLFELGQVQYTMRETEIKLFHDTVSSMRKENQQAGCALTEELLDQKASIFKTIRNLQEQYKSKKIFLEEYNIEIDDYAIAFSDLIHKTWKGLMKLQLEMFEVMEEVNNIFERSIDELVNTFVQEATAIFAQLRILETTYLENITDCANIYVTNRNMDESVPAHLRLLVKDKDVLNNAVASSHEKHIQVIDTREETLTERIRQWQINFTSNLNKDELVRSRQAILEINHFLDVQREDFEELTFDETFIEQ